MMGLASRSLQSEQMDADDLDPSTYAAVLADLARVNRVTLAHRATIAFVARLAGGRSRLRILDVGYGHGDLLRALVRWGQRQGLTIEATGIDLNARSSAVARAATPADLGIDFRTGDYCELAGGGFDIIVSSLVAHHMASGELEAFVRFMEKEARLGWIVNDLHRHLFAYLGYPVLARLAGWHPMVRQDGQLSIARSFRPREWPEILEVSGLDPRSVRVVRRFPFRLCVERTR